MASEAGQAAAEAPAAPAASGPPALGTGIKATAQTVPICISWSRAGTDVAVTGNFVGWGQGVPLTKDEHGVLGTRAVARHEEPARDTSARSAPPRDRAAPSRWRAHSVQVHRGWGVEVRPFTALVCLSNFRSARITSRTPGPPRACTGRQTTSETLTTLLTSMRVVSQWGVRPLVQAALVLQQRHSAPCLASAQALQWAHRRTRHSLALKCAGLEQAALRAWSLSACKMPVCMPQSTPSTRQLSPPEQATLSPAC